MKTFSIHLKILLTDISIQTESLTMMIQQIIQYFISFSASSILNASYFNESNTTRFLNQFKLLSRNHEMKNMMLIKKFLKYCKSEIQKKIKTQKNYITAD